MTATLCLKARPTAAQLADRLRPLDGALPGGLELYLDVADLRDEHAMSAALGHIEQARSHLPDDFAWLIEGPVGSLDGGFFDVTRESHADALVVQRLATMARAIGARAVNIHLIAPSDDLARLTLACRAHLLAKCVSFLQGFVDLMLSAGTTPTVENMPPVLRMRRGGFYFTPIGMASEDLLWAADQVPGLKLLPDTSHAGLYLNARRDMVADATSQPWLGPLRHFLRQLPADAPDLLGYVQSLSPHVANAQVSNARGVLGEGLPYAEGDFNLDTTIVWLGEHAQHVVTETLEPDPEHAYSMRDALRRMRSVLA